MDPASLWCEFDENDLEPVIPALQSFHIDEAESRTPSIMHTLAPAEIISLILSFLDHVDLLRLLQVNKHYLFIVAPVAVGSIVPDFEPKDLPITYIDEAFIASALMARYRAGKATSHAAIANHHRLQLVKAFVRRPTLETYRIGIPPPWRPSVHQSLKPITSLSLDFTEVSVYDPGFVLNIALQLENLRQLKVTGLAFRLSQIFKYRDMHEVASYPSAPLNLQRLTLLAHEQTTIHGPSCRYLKGLFNSLPKLQAFTMFYPDLSLGNLLEILDALRPIAPQLQHLGLAVSPARSGNHVFRSIDFEKFISLQSLAIPATFLHWDYLGHAWKTNLPESLPPNLEMLQLQSGQLQGDYGHIQTFKTYEAVRCLFDEAGRLHPGKLKWFGWWESESRKNDYKSSELMLATLRDNGVLYKARSFARTPAIRWA